MIGFGDRPFDDVPLAFEHLGLLAHVLGHRVERGQLLVGRLAQLVQLREASELVLNLLHRFDGEG